MPRVFLSPSRLRRQPPPRGGLTARRCRADGTSYPKGICSAALHGRTPSPTRGSTYRPVGRGPRAPPKNAYPAAGHMGPALQVHTPPNKQRGTPKECRVISSSAGRHASSSLSSSSPAASTMTSAPASASPSRPRKPQLTPIIGSPAFRAVATSTSLSPT